ncbi:uncharacterized protein LOC125861356 [Solanum stenotomum]|uniref:uncharacterized protein LOC125861356 n=1 Tax=Solanum stenotomum TaxID=172797 RepID=UPI0020D10216|nr:uncharacterized protein LOC125861356 [Solanum stenotomum]
MDFVVGLPRTSRGLDSIWVIVHQLTKLAHFIPVHTSYSAERLAHRGPQFTSSFWRTFQDELGMRVDLSTTFHPQTDGQLERTIQVLEDMLRACVMDFGEPRPRGTDLMREALDHVRVIQDRLRTAQSRHRSYADRRRRPLKYAVVGEVTYELVLPPAFSAIHPVFHVSMLCRYVPDEFHVIQYDAIDLDDSFRYIEEPIAILVRDVRRLRSRAIPVVKTAYFCSLLLGLVLLLAALLIGMARTRGRAPARGRGRPRGHARATSPGPRANSGAGDRATSSSSIARSDGPGTSPPTAQACGVTTLKIN